MANLDLTSLSASDGFLIEGDLSQDHAGYSVAGLGDINGDGYDDLVIGAPGGDGGGAGSGQIYLIYGKATGFGALDLSALSAADGFELTGQVAGDSVGYSVAGADMNGDGTSEVIVGAPGADGGAGAAFLIFPGVISFGDPFVLTNPFASYVYGASAGDQLGASVASAGDVNGDGYGDFIIGAPGGDNGGADAGQAYVIFGTSFYGLQVDVSTLTATQGFAIQGDNAGDGLGLSVSSAGDINGDGYDDIVVGAHNNDAGGTDAGAAYVIFGKASGFGTVDVGSLGANGFTIIGDVGGDHLGISVASLGDINNDGYDDIIVGADANGGTGSAYVVFGKAGGFTNIDLTSFSASAGFTIHGAASGDLAGFSVSTAGDVNGDGYDDMLVGVPGNDSGGSNAGAAYLIYGKASGFVDINLATLSTADGYKIQGDVAGDLAGSSVSGGGDLNNDGYDDLIVGAYDSDLGGTDAGTAYVIFGHSTATGTTAPVAVDDALNGLHDQANNYTAAQILSNDIDADGDPLHIQSVHNAQHGQVVLNGDGSVTFTPDAGYTGQASFEYILSDGNGGTNRAEVRINVLANNAPVAVDDSLASTAEQTPITFAASAILGNDTDPNSGDTLTIGNVSNPFGGNVVLNGDGTVTFTPATNFEGTASFNYVVSDGHGGTDTGHATFTVTGVQDPPTANDDALQALQDTSVNYRADKLLGNDTDPDLGNVLAIQSVSNPINGTVTLETNGSVTFNPTGGFTGTAGFDYVLSDGHGGTDTAHVTITVGSGFAPVAADDVVIGFQDTPTTYYDYDLIYGSGLDTDADGDTLVLSDAFNAVGGQVTFNSADGTITFTPDPLWLGYASFDYEVSDGNGGTDIGTAEVILLAIDHPSVANNDVFTTDEATAITTGNLFDDNGAGADSDADGDPLAISDVNGNAGAVGTQITLTSGALLTVNADGTFDYDPNGVFDYLPTLASGASNTPQTDSFSYTLNGIATATVTITVNGLDTNDTLLGTAGPDTLSGGVGNDLLNGLAGADSMSGGIGDDRYIVNNAGDIVTEASGAGSDTVRSVISYTLTANVEKLVLFGVNAINGTGNTLDNELFGNSAANVLDGLGGADRMTGLGGNDTYHVDNAGDLVIEGTVGGTDTVMSSISYRLGVNVENLTLIGSAAIDATGNSLNNVLIGNSGDNLLNGGAGADSMAGGAGDDHYIVNNAGDTVTEASGAGVDTVHSSLTYTLAANVERLVLEGASTIDGTGNGLDNELFGNAAANVLDGLGGADSMSGMDGDDTYYVDNAGDFVIEAKAAGTDIVMSSISHRLGANVENLTLIGSAAIDGTGNGLDNVLTGNADANFLSGLTGADTINGGLGNDILRGGADADTFVFDSALGAGNVDRIIDFATATDHIMLDSAIFTALTGPTLDASAFYAGSAAHDADDRIIFDASTGNIYYDADGDGAGAQVLFADLSSGLTVTNTDFLVA